MAFSTDAGLANVSDAVDSQETAGGREARKLEERRIKLARLGHDAAWEELVRENQEPIFRLAYLILRDAAEAEDAAQEAFMQAYISIDSFDPTRPIRPWLSRMVINKARNRRRSLGRYMKQLQKLASKNPEPVPKTSRLEGRAESRQRAEKLWSAVMKLNQKSQDVIYLRYFLNMSEQEMAETLSAPRGTIKSRLSRSLKGLEKEIRRNFPELEEWLEIE